MAAILMFGGFVTLSFWETFPPQKIYISFPLHRGKKFFSHQVTRKHTLSFLVGCYLLSVFVLFFCFLFGGLKTSTTIMVQTHLLCLKKTDFDLLFHVDIMWTFVFDIS